jgi:hypothetical protein
MLYRYSNIAACPSSTLPSQLGPRPLDPWGMDRLRLFSVRLDILVASQHQAAIKRPSSGHQASIKRPSSELLGQSATSHIPTIPVLPYGYCIAKACTARSSVARQHNPTDAHQRTKRGMLGTILLTYSNRLPHPGTAYQLPNSY